MLISWAVGQVASCVKMSFYNSEKGTHLSPRTTQDRQKKEGSAEQVEINKGSFNQLVARSFIWSLWGIYTPHSPRPGGGACQRRGISGEQGGSPVFKLSPLPLRYLLASVHRAGHHTKSPGWILQEEGGEENQTAFIDRAEGSAVLTGYGHQFGPDIEGYQSGGLAIAMASQISGAYKLAAPWANGSEIN
ncbi:unnamed protein product [Nezara viridula]|uniref:Uncharacterized protein n=1 Tax=Nezara viridula TaxID=85310 RepID=A0A9P0MRE0_NEZVI|nr:unnamed protein product [Nezara viridula]